jgi:opacity protein-like surface antigen
MPQPRYRCLLLSTCLSLLLAAPLHADDAPAIVDPTPASATWTSPLQTGARALLFSIRSNFDLQSFDGGAISFKTQRSPTSAWRFGLSFNANTRDQDQSQSSQFSDTLTITNTADLNGNSETIGLSAHYLRYFDPVERVSLYFGGGPEVGWLRDRQNQTTSSSDGSIETVVTVEDTRDAWSAGLGGTIGVEWFCAKRISLIGEYLCDVSYFQDSGESHFQLVPPGGLVKRTFESEGFRFNSQGVRAGVSAYFK